MTQRYFIPKLTTATTSTSEGNQHNMTPVRIPDRLTACNIVATLEKLNLNVAVLKALVASGDSEAAPSARFGVEGRTSPHALELRKVDAALAKHPEISVSDRIRFKWMLDSRNLLKK